MSLHWSSPRPHMLGPCGPHHDHACTCHAWSCESCFHDMHRSCVHTILSRLTWSSRQYDPISISHTSWVHKIMDDKIQHKGSTKEQCTVPVCHRMWNIAYTENNNVNSIIHYNTVRQWRIMWSKLRATWYWQFILKGFVWLTGIRCPYYYEQSNFRFENSSECYCKRDDCCL